MTEQLRKDVAALFLKHGLRLDTIDVCERQIIFIAKNPNVPPPILLPQVTGR